MNYYYDTEFIEGTQTKRFIGIPVGKTKPTIDLISIGIVSEDGREFYAISKDFNLKEAWDRYDLEIQSGDMRNQFPNGKKVYWIRDNVLKPIFEELNEKYQKVYDNTLYDTPVEFFTYSSLKYLLSVYGKSNKQIAKEVAEFCNCSCIFSEKGEMSCSSNDKFYSGSETSFYTYYGAYDHVVFCWLFGKMLNLPKGFPMYSVDLKQMLDEKAKLIPVAFNVEAGLISIKFHEDYPKQENIHNALDDAKWNKKLHEFIKSQL